MPDPSVGCADLEIGLHRQDGGCYSVDLRFSLPDSDADVRPVRGVARFDLEGLLACEFDTPAYGRLLAANLFADEAVRTAYGEARRSAQALDVPLRVRLFIGPTAPELQALHWETLHDPQTGAPLLLSEHLLLSRYLSSLDWRPVRLRPRGELRALVVIANPSDVGEYAPGGVRLAPVDVMAEMARARSGLGEIPVTALASGGSATLANLCASLRDGFDLLYLVCHGALVDGEPLLWLEDEHGASARTAGAELVQRLAEMRERPRLIVLASCQSAGTGEAATMGDAGALAALGPRLAEAGVPAVLAMQGNVTIRTIAEFMPVFFAELARDGQIDRAMAVARGAVRRRADHWLPVLFMRLKSGRLWYVPGFAGERPGFERWPALLNNIHQGRCTPILGFGLLDPLLGPSRDIARRWAEAHGYPMEPHEREDLPQVAEFLAVNQDEGFLRDTMAADLRQELLRRYGDSLPEDVRGAGLQELLAAAGALRRVRETVEPFSVLAALPFPLYITTNPDTLLEDALTAADRAPRVELCRWREEGEWPPSVYDQDANYRPDDRQPLVYHLFGHLKWPDSLVLTEDDYFDYLIGVTRNNDLIPAAVRRRLADTALLFLGFQMDDWGFRVLFRSLMGQEGRGRRKKYAHVAVQIDPEGGRILEPDRARRYLERYFEDADISIYWGTADDFLKELHQRAARDETPPRAPSRPQEVPA